MTPFKIEKVTELPSPENRQLSCLYVVKPIDYINKAELYMTSAYSTDVVQISTNSVIIDLINKTNAANNPLVIGIGFKDNVTALTTGTNVAYVRSPRTFLCTKIRASVNTPSTSGPVKVDILKSGSSILPMVYDENSQTYVTQYLQIDEGQETSVTSVITFNELFSTFMDDEKITIDVAEAGTGTTGLIVSLFEGLDPNAY